jgi:hypothetical protein
LAVGPAVVNARPWGDFVQMSYKSGILSVMLTHSTPAVYPRFDVDGALHN